MSRRDFRRAKRSRRRNAAWIGLGNDGIRIPCVLWDISDSGARLAAPRAKVLPAAFNLVLSKDGRSRRQCRVVWRNERQLGVQFIQATVEELEEEAARRPTAIAAPGGGVATASLVLPGYGSVFLETPERRGIRISSFAAGMLFMLVAATALFFAAGIQSAVDVPWAMALCDGAGNFCQHPEWTGMAGGLMTVVYLAVRGMEI
jgi:hypothetical protein